MSLSKRGANNNNNNNNNNKPISNAPDASVTGPEAQITWFPLV